MQVPVPGNFAADDSAAGQELKSFAVFLHQPLIIPLRAFFADDQAKNARKGVMSGVFWVRSRENRP